MNEPTELNGRTAIITGAGSGIGAAIARELALAGAHVLALDLRFDAAAAVAAAIRDAGGSAEALAGDVTDPATASKTAEHLLATHGRIDILVNNAGVQFVAPIDSYPLEKWHQLIAVLLTAPFLFTQAVLPAMRRQRWGRIINLSSINGKIGAVGKAPYCSAKHGIIGLTRVAALETARDGITVNAICPGYTDTPMVRGQLTDLAQVHGVPEAEAVERIILPMVPQGRLLDDKEIASFARYLAGPAAVGITGQAINVSGGLVMH